MCRKLRNWSSQVADLKLRTSEKIAIAELRSCGCGTTFLQKLRNCDSGGASFKLRNCDCGLKKKLRLPTSGNGVTITVTLPTTAFTSVIACFSQKNLHTKVQNFIQPPRRRVQVLQVTELWPVPASDSRKNLWALSGTMQFWCLKVLSSEF